MDIAGHIQATGRDDEGRQYHLPCWEAVRNRVKFERLGPRLGAARRCGGSLTGTWRSGTFRGRVIALVIRLLDALYIRIGNPEYAERAYGRRRC
ncbi:MAG: hypothetical protein R2851_02975 [Caldilineaceae bacterium]